MRTTVAVLVLMLGGCSLLSTSSHPHTGALGERTCDSYGVVMVDGFVGVTGMALGTVAIIDDQTTSQRDGWKGMGTVLGAGLIALTLPWTISAVVGVSRIRACSSAQRGPYAGTGSPASYAPRSGAAPE